MDINQMKIRCPNFVLKGTGFIKDHKLAFTRVSKKRESGVADIIETPGSKVWGTFYELTDIDIKRLDNEEGFPFSYGKKSIIVYSFFRHNSLLRDIQRRPEQINDLFIDYYGNVENYKSVEAFTYYVKDKIMDKSIFPSLEYMKQIIEGALENGLPSEYIKEISMHARKAIEIKSQQAVDFFLNLNDILNSDILPDLVVEQEEFAGANLVITNNPGRQFQLEIQYPEDLVILTPYSKELSWIINQIYSADSINWQIDYYSKYDILNQLGMAAIDFQREHPENNSYKGICEAVILKGYNLFTNYP